MPVLHSLPVILPASPIAIPGGSPIGYFASQPGIRNTESTGVLIDEIAFSMFGLGGLNLYLPAIRVEVKWHNEVITDGAVCLGAVGRAWNRFGEDVQARSILLSKPIYLEPGDYLSVAIVNDLIAGGPAATFYPTAIGRQALVPPDERTLPYLCDYIGPAYAVNSGNAIADQSAPSDLGNPFDTDLFVERLIGRVLYLGPTPYYSEAQLTPVWNTFQLRLSDHRDNWWIATPTPVPSVFAAQDRSWILNHVLESKGFLRAEFEGIANGLAGAGATLSRAVVGLVGYRRIA